MKKELKEIQEMIYTIATQFNNDIVTKFSYDIIDGLRTNKKTYNERLNAWKDYLIDLKENNSVTEEQRNGIMVPAIPL